MEIAEFASIPNGWSISKLSGQLYGNGFRIENKLGNRIFKGEIQCYAYNRDPDGDRPSERNLKLKKFWRGELNPNHIEVIFADDDQMLNGNLKEWTGEEMGQFNKKLLDMAITHLGNFKTSNLYIYFPGNQDLPKRALFGREFSLDYKNAREIQGQNYHRYKLI